MTNITQRKNKRLSESAVVPNSVEVTAIREQGLGNFESKEMVFARWFPQARSDIITTSKKAIEDFKEISRLRSSYKCLFFPLRTDDVRFSEQVMANIEEAQKNQNHFVMHEPDINQSFQEFKKQYEGTRIKHTDIIPVLDPAMLSIEELRKKAEYLAEKNPDTLLIKHRHPLDYASSYIQIMRYFNELNTRIIDVGIWPRYVTKGKNFGCSQLPAPVIIFGIDAVCHGVTKVVFNKKPNVVFLDRDWKYKSANKLSSDFKIGNKVLKDILSEENEKNYLLSRVQAIIRGNVMLKELRASTTVEIENLIRNSEYLTEIFRQSASFRQEG